MSDPIARSRRTARPLADELWTFDGEPIRFLGFPYALRMTVIRLGDGSLLLHSPIQHSAALQRELNELGEIRFIVTPNKLHHLFVGHWLEHCPKARAYAPPGLPKRRPDLRFAGLLGDEPEPAWEAELDQCLFSGSWFMDEVVFFHRSSRSLLLGDLIENHDPARFTRLQRFVARLNRMYGSTPINYRLTFWRRAPARRALQRMLAWKPQRVIVMHGPIIEHDAERLLEREFSWLGRGDT